MGKKYLHLILWMALMLLLPSGSWAQKATDRVSRGSMPGLWTVRNQSKQAFNPTRRTATRTARAQRPLRLRVAQTGGDSLTLYGLTPGQSSWDDWRIVSFAPSANMAFSEIFSDEHLEASGNAVYAEGKLYVTTYSSNYYGEVQSCTQYVYDAKNWKLESQRDVSWPQPIANTMTYDPTTGQVFLIRSYDDGGVQGYAFGTMDLGTGEMNIIRVIDSDENIGVLAASPDGNLYAINKNGMLETIDKNTGEITKIGNTDVKLAQYQQGAVFDQKTGTMYWAAVDDSQASILYKVNTTDATVTKVGDIPDGAEIVTLFIPDGEPSADAPSKVTNVGFDFDGDDLSGNITFHSPATTVGGTTLTGKLTATVQTGGKNYTAEVDPDADCSVAVSPGTTGYATVNVSVANAAGSSERVSAQHWIGPDNPTTPANVTLTRNGTTATVKWNRPTTGAHGGHIDPAQVTYRVVMNNDVLANDYTDTTYTCEIPGEAMQSIVFRIYPFYKNLIGEEARSNSVVFGDGYVAPCSLSFYDDFTFNQCTVIDANNDGTTFTQNYNGAVISTYSQADDWLITPKIKMKSGQSYKLTVPGGIRSVMYPETVVLCLGNDTTVDAMTQVIDTMTFTSRWASGTVSFSVPSDGSYNIGMHCISSGWQLSISGLSIAEEADMTAPAAPDSLTVTPADKGQLAATVRFIAPAKDLNDNGITGKETIMITRSKEGSWGVSTTDTIATLSDITPGQVVTYNDNTPTLGDNTYTVVAYNANGSKGKEATTAAYIGVDKPGVPTNALLVQDGDNARLTWNAPTTGSNGGYIDPAKLDYYIIDPSYGDIIKEGLTDTVYTEPITVIDGYQYGLGYGIVANNEAGNTGRGAMSNDIVIGNPYPVPMTENFPNGMTNYSWFTTQSSSDNAGWSTETGEGYDGAAGYTRFTSDYDMNTQSLISGKISLAGTENPTLHFKMVGFGGTDSLIVSVSNDFNGVYKPVKEMIMTSYPESEWTDIDIPLSEFKDDDYIHIAFTAIPKNYYCNIVLDQINIRDVYQYDAAINRLTVDNDETTVGKDSIKVTARVINQGTEALTDGGYTVSFFAGGRLLDEVQGVALPYMSTAELSATFKPTVKDSAKVNVYAVVNYSGDEDEANNTSDSIKAYVFKPARPVVTDLKATANGSNARLTWTQPDLSGTPAQTVTDDFESYRPFQINHFGDWTARDIDGSAPAGPSWLYYPNMDSPMAWDVFNTSQIVDCDQYWPAYSGEQYLVDIAATSGDNDDWLITPELSGNAQTVSFWSRSASEEYGHEMFRVYYSTTDTALASFTALDGVVRYVPAKEWTNYEFELPEGAKYFAVRCISHDRQAMMVDDFSYEECAHPLEVTFVGYNVYRNGEKVNDDVLTSPEYETVFADGDEFYVEVVYDLGESDPSNTVRLTATGISAIDAADDNDNSPVYDIAGRKVSPSTRGLHIKKGKKYVVD